MAGNLFSIAKTGLVAAQAGLSTTGHNITNANVVGYSRQLAVQKTSLAQDFGYGFVGSGTEITQIKRYSSDFLSAQVRTAQSTFSAQSAYSAQISQIDNVLADASAGLSPALQDFFKSVQDAASNSGSAASRQGLLSAADTLASRFQALDSRMQEIRDGLNAQIESNVTLINSYAQQIAEMNDQIGAYSNNLSSPPNDLLDRRDQLIVDLNKQVRATVMPGTNNSLTVSIGSGQPLVVGAKSYALSTTVSSVDPRRVEIGYQTGSRVTPLSDASLQGGELGGLLEFRAESLDRAQNAIGRVAIALAHTFNAQHRLGWDLNGTPGGDFFKLAPITAMEAASNTGPANATPSITIADPAGLSLGDYDMTFNGTDYVVTRVPGNDLVGTFSHVSGGAVVEGLRINVGAGTPAAGDRFRIRPTAEGASGFAVNVKHVNEIAAAAPIATGPGANNTGSGKISEGVVSASYMAAPLPGVVTFTYDKAAGGFRGTVGTGSPPADYPSSAVIPYTAGSELAIGGMKFTISGQPNEGDTFTIAPNIGGVGDNRNMRLLGQLQTTNILNGNASTFQGAYAELVSYVGNKAREVQVNADASGALLDQAHASQQQVAGVNLDEEAANLLKYQQAYQAAGKAMQIASTLFDTLLSLGR